MTGYDTEDDSSDVPCAWDGCGDIFDTERGMKIHHKTVHGESIGGVKTPCHICGDPTWVTAGNFEKTDRNFCGEQCRREWREDNPHNIQYSDEEVVGAIRELADELGKTPTKEEMNDVGNVSPGLCQNRFGTWNNALRKAGFEPNIEQSAYSEKEELLANIQEAAEELDRAPKMKEMRGLYGVSGKTYATRFGTWNNALRKAGIKPRYYKKVSDEELIDELKRVGDEVGHRPRLGDIKTHGRYGGRTYISHFGSWSNALSTAGYKPQVQISDEDLERELQEYAEQLGRAPRKSEASEHLSYGMTTYRTRFGDGGWKSVLETVGIDTDDLFPDPVPMGEGWDARRELALERDGYACTACGKGEEDLPRMPDVHHITPRSAFLRDDGTFEKGVHALDNLITLCHKCHMEIERFAPLLPSGIK